MNHHRARLRIRTILNTWRDAVAEHRDPADTEVADASRHALRLLDELAMWAVSSDSLNRMLDQARAEVTRVFNREGPKRR